jgi:REP-associated tyrosine transposase
MGRPPRSLIAGATYHVTSLGNQRQAIYLDDDDRRYFLALQNRIVRRCGWEQLAHCLMTNHFHLVIKTLKPNLSAGMHRLNGGYARYFNERYARDGHLFARRYGSRLIETESHFSETLRYVALNPVRAGLCAHPSEWPWSSFHALDRTFRFDG